MEGWHCPARIRRIYTGVNKVGDDEMSPSLIMILAIALSEMLSAFLLYKLWKREEFLFMKALISLLLIIPFLGPAMYFFITDNEKTTAALNNTMPRGEYTHRWVSIRGLFVDESPSKKKEGRPEQSKNGGKD